MRYTLQRMVLMAVVGAVVVGCASNMPVTPETAKAIANREVTIAGCVAPPFMPMTPGRIMLGVVGASIMANAGPDLLAKNNIADPAAYIGEQLSQGLAAKYGIAVSSRSITLYDDDVQAIAKSNPTADLVLEVRTTGWGFVNYPTDWEKYRVMYDARLRLIDAKGGSVLAAGDCHRWPDKTSSSPTYEELFLNGAERLKKELREAAEFCVGEFKTKVFQM